MKKLALISLGILILVVAAYSVWIQFPRIEDPAEVTAIQNRVLARHQLAQSVADDPDQNGYLDPVFLPYWGREGKEYKDGSEVEKFIENWNAKYSSSSTGSEVDHEMLLATPDEAYIEALSQIESYYPKLSEDFAKPYFEMPSTEIDFEAEGPNLIAVRAIGQALVGYAEALVAQDKSEQAVKVLIDVSTFGYRVRQDESLISNMIGISIQAISFSGLLSIDPSRVEFTLEKWTEMASDTKQVLFPQDAMARALETDLVSFQNTMKRYAGKGGSPFHEGGFRVPGWEAREQRIYTNTLVEVIKSARVGNFAMPSFLSNPTSMDWMSGRTGLMATLVIPNFARGGDQIEFVRNKIAALNTVYSVMAYRAKTGRFPDSLEQVEDSGIAMVDEPSLRRRMTYSRKTNGVDIRVEMYDANSMIAVGNPLENEAQDWVTVDGRALIFHLK